MTDTGTGKRAQTARASAGTDWLVFVEGDDGRWLLDCVNVPTEPYTGQPSHERAAVEAAQTHGAGRYIVTGIAFEMALRPATHFAVEFLGYPEVARQRASGTDASQSLKDRSVGG